MQAGWRLSAQGEAESISAGELNALRITDGSTQSVFSYKSVTCFTKISVSPFFTRKLQLFIDSYKELLYYYAHNLIMGDEEKRKCTSLAKRAFVTVQEGAGGDIEDGLGADGLRCLHLGRPGAPVTVLEY